MWQGRFPVVSIRSLGSAAPHATTWNSNISHVQPASGHSQLVNPNEQLQHRDLIFPMDQMHLSLLLAGVFSPKP